MKKKLRSLILILGMATPTLYAGCLTNLGREVRDAAVTGTADAVHDSIFDLILQNLPMLQPPPE